MPELPEVETVAAKVHELCLGLRVVGYIVKGDVPANIAGARYDLLRGGLVTDVKREGKTILIHTESGPTLVSHLGMSGYWDSAERPWTFDYVEGSRRATDSDVRLELLLWDGIDLRRTLRYHDARKFGRVVVHRRPPSRSVGPELTATPLGERATCLPVLVGRVRAAGDRAVKDAIMDQRVVAGIGNIYASEALWLAGVRPDAPVSSLDDRTIADVLRCADAAMRFSLERSIDYTALWVYRRRRCAACQSPIERLEVTRRTSHACPKCQR